MFTYHHISIYFLLIFLTGLLAFGCKRTEKPNTEEVITASSENDITLTTEQWKIAGIQVAPIEWATIKKTITLNGHLVAGPNQSITVTSPLQGIISKILIRPGQEVQEGQALLLVEDREFIQWQEAYLTAKASLQFAVKDFQRQKELNATNATSAKVLEGAEEKMVQLQIACKAWEEKLKLLKIKPGNLTPETMVSTITVRAPKSGMITDMFINLGKHVAPGTEMITMITLDSPNIVLKAFEKDLYQIKPNMSIQVYNNEPSAIKWPAKVDQVIHQIREGGYTEVYASFTKKPSSLFPGNFINAEIEFAAAESIMVPEKALVSFENKDYIFLETGAKKYKMVEVKKGQYREGKVAISLDQNFSTFPVVIHGAYTLLMALQNVEE